MKHLLPALLFFIVVNIIPGISFGQIDAPAFNPPKTTVTFFGGSVFTSRLHYFGRTDSLKSNALLPTVLVQFDSVGLYVNGTGVLLNNKQQSLKYAGTIVEAGYRFGKLKGIAGNVFASKFFYNTQQLPQSALKAQAGINLSHLNNILNLTTSGSIAFSNKTDFFAAAGINHPFKWIKDKSVFLVTPTLMMNAGSQKFINSYYRTSSIPGLPFPDQEEVIEISKKFSILSYEMSMPLVFARKQIFFIVTPSYVIPQNIVTVPNHPELSENASNLFYTNVTLLFSFKK